MKKEFIVHDDSTLSAREFHEKFKKNEPKDCDLFTLDIFEPSSDEDEEKAQEKAKNSKEKPTYRAIAKANEVIKKPPKDHTELVNCFRERLYLQSHLKYTPVEEQKELADVLIMAIRAVWPQHRKQATHPFLSENGNVELQRRVAVCVIETVERLFYEYVTKAEELNSQHIFSSQANLSRLKTQILHEANKSLDVLTLRRKITDDMRDNGGWLKHPKKGYIKTLLKVLHQWTKVTQECASHKEYVRRQMRDLKTMMPDLENHPMREPLTQLIHHYHQLVEERAREANGGGLVLSEYEGVNEEENEEEEEKGSRNDCENEDDHDQGGENRLSHKESISKIINDLQITLEDLDEGLNPRVVYRRSNSMPRLHDDLSLHEGFEDLGVGELRERKQSIEQMVLNDSIKETAIKKNVDLLSPREDLHYLIAKKNQKEETPDFTDNDFSPLLQAQKPRSPRKKKVQPVREKPPERSASNNELTPAEVERLEKKAEEYSQPPTLNIKVPGKKIVRICDGRISKRTNASALTLNMHPTIYNEFLDEVDMETINDLDHHLYAGLEIQEVYNEITKSSTKDFLAFDLDDCVEKCPEKCRNLPVLFMSGLLHEPTNVRFLNPELQSCEQSPWKDHDDVNEWKNEPKFAGIGREDMLKIQTKADLRRSGLFESVDLGGAGQLAKNYASWLTWYKNNIDVDDYRKFISNHETDYLCQLHHLYDSNESEEVILEAERTSAHLKMLREREEIRRKLLQEKCEYHKGFWNAQCINLGGLGREPDVAKIPSDTDKKSPEEPDRHTSFLYLQNRLEQIWKLLRMPDGQRVDMAIKHSSDPTLEKLNRVVQAWDSITKLIVERENWMAKLEAFERNASDPNRFFEKGAKGSSIVRLNESRVREKLEKEIKRLDVEIIPMLEDLKRKFNDDVTYQGRNYMLKIQSDRTEMLYWLQQERRTQRIQELNNKFQLTPLSTVDLSAPVN